jgi:nucleoside-diphosphate-sugar epimerase
MLTGKRASFTSGEQLYDFVHISDAVKGIMAVEQKGKKNTAYYIGSNKPRKLKEFISIIRDTIDPSIILYLGELPYNGRSLSLEEYDISKLTADTGYEPKVNFEDGIKTTIEWLRTKTDQI